MAGQQFTTSVNATSSNATVAFGFQPTQIKIINNAAATITAYVSFVSSAATTALDGWPVVGQTTEHIRIEKLSVAAGLTSHIGIITATGSTAALVISALKV